MNTQGKLIALILSSALAAPAAQAEAPPNYAGIFGSYLVPDSVRNADYGLGWHLMYGSPINEWLSVELNVFGHESQHQTDANFDYTYGGGLDLRFFRGTEFFGGYLLGGFGAYYEDLPGEEEVSPYANIGVGMLLQMPAPNLHLRTEAREYIVFNDEFYPGEDMVFDTRINVGLQFLFDDLPIKVVGAGGLRDSDGDGVIDGADDCPNTPPGTTVNGRGCPVPQDEDGDGIPNTVDECPMTPRGTLVDIRGCPAAVPEAPRVDGDEDGDGVRDSQDRCAFTRPGAVVDAYGCPVDQDDDGVLNTADQCPDTPKGLKVDDRGCALQAQSIVLLRNVHFEFDSAKLTTEARRILDGVVAGMRGQPTMLVKLGGHCDALGTQEYNLRLSDARANSVRNFLIERGVDPSRLQAEGYGEFNPIADNETEEGRAQNRRVEFEVLQQ